ncbi:hypothetical protein GCM10027289_04150 [Tsukamurella serpentis]
MGSSYFTGQGSGYRGTHFQTPDGSVKCNIKGLTTGSAAICYSPTADFTRIKISSRSSDPRSANSVGWSSGEQETYARYSDAPLAALFQGDLFNGSSAALDPGQKVTVPVNLLSETVICGNRGNNITCVVKRTSHGFTISKTSVTVW